MVTFAAGRTARLTCALATLTLASSACATAGTGAGSSMPPAGAPSPTSNIMAMPIVADAGADARWADSVLATLSLRDKAAQMVWPWILGDYTAVDNPAWLRVERLIREQKLGGVIISVGGPIDIATKTNALQRAASLPLLVGADLETGAAFRARGVMAPSWRRASTAPVSISEGSQILAGGRRPPDP